MRIERLLGAEPARHPGPQPTDFGTSVASEDSEDHACGSFRPLLTLPAAAMSR